MSQLYLGFGPSSQGVKHENCDCVLTRRAVVYPFGVLICACIYVSIMALPCCCAHISRPGRCVCILTNYSLPHLVCSLSLLGTLLADYSLSLELDNTACMLPVLCRVSVQAHLVSAFILIPFSTIFIAQLAPLSLLSPYASLCLPMSPDAISTISTFFPTLQTPTLLSLSPSS